LEVFQAIKSRRSIRGYKSVPVPKETLTQVLEIASYAPSANNIQPWQFIVLGGETLDQLKRGLEEKLASRAEPHPDFEPGPSPTGVYRSRQVELAKSLFQLMGIARDDREKRKQWLLKMVRFFDAPNAIIIATDAEVSGHLSTLAIGAISQNIALAAVNFGLGTCIENAVVLYPEVIRQILDIPQSKKIVIGIAIGYPDWDFPANKVQVSHEPLANTTSWHGV
jgi:nitroreductase